MSRTSSPWRVNASSAGQPGAASTTCFDIRNNSVSTAAIDGNYGLVVLSGSGSNLMRLVDIGIASPTQGQVEAYLATNNTSASGDALLASAFAGPAGHYTTAASCRAVP